MDRRKILMIFGGAWVSAALLTWFLWAQTKAPKTERMVRAMAAMRDLPAGTRIRKSDLKGVDIREKDLPKAAVLDERTALDRVLLFPVNANETIIATKLSSAAGADGIPATIEPGKRAISVQINEASGVAGLVQPRARVDVLFTRTGSMAEALTTTILEDVVVLSVGRSTEVQTQTGTTGATATAQRPVTASAVTLLLTPEQAAKLELAKNQGKISLALRNPLDRSTITDTNPVTAEVLDPMIYSRVPRRPGAVKPNPAIPNVRDPNVWAKLTGEAEESKKPEKVEPPKPRFVIDVYRGDKHIQETFQ
jgi:pilus assembly protein CpaB